MEQAAWSERLAEILRMNASTETICALLEALASEGCTDARYELGMRRYYNEQAEAAAKCFRQAADEGQEYAACAFGFCCEEGLGVAPNRTLALDYYRQSAEVPYAAFRLGVHREANAGGPEDLRQAAEYYLFYLDHADSDGCEWDTDGDAAAAWLGLGRCLLQLPEAQRPRFAPSPLRCFEEALGVGTRKEAAAARFQLGRMRLFGIETASDPAAAAELLSEAAADGVTEAAALLRQISAWDRIPSEIKSADNAAQREEALLRLAILEEKGVDPDVRMQYAKTGCPGYAADDCRGFSVFSPDDKPEIQAAIADLQLRGLTVYFVHESLTLTYGTMAALLYVSDDPAQWPTERMDLLRGTPIAAVANLTENYTEIGKISFDIHDQLMERLY